MMNGYGDDIFMVKSMREDIEFVMFDKEETLIPWSSLVPLKLNFFAWCDGLDRIAFKGNLHRRGVSVSFECDVCDVAVESVDHLLIRCKKLIHAIVLSIL
ncbi:hypothetical protein QVD17_18266 [Tagetes erecta]|uniref:Reverse transcriptase zinc-binding domain-containing protein n=1 Tax=Tagetes erecta TaxID=13708 RepID=A0AAD8NW45_TARER|nr:hypothetical protein QVD17_18266 [Tagetes erecta]